VTGPAGVHECADCVCVQGPPPEPLKVITWLDEGRAMVEVSGDLDMFTSLQLAAALTGIQSTAHRPVLVLVLTDLAFADSNGLGVLVSAYKRAKVRGGAVALVEVPEHLQRVLRVTGLDALLPAFESLEDAWAYLDRVAP
jgi:anti-sigma B factor antagonist